MQEASDSLALRIFDAHVRNGTLPTLTDNAQDNKGEIVASLNSNGYALDDRASSFDLFAAASAIQAAGILTLVSGFTAVSFQHPQTERWPSPGIDQLIFGWSLWKYRIERHKALCHWRGAGNEPSSVVTSVTNNLVLQAKISSSKSS